ncbi:MAG TPA: hypothetical protein VK907_14785 [Phnomibacter sp.]|nr:hypothetical protein [Phnomibacter sp.]
MVLTRLLLFLLLMPCAAGAQVQGNAILVLKKNNKTLAKFYPGSFISFYTTEGMPVHGSVSRLTPDSIYIEQYSIRRMMRADGALVFDTSNIYRAMFHLNNIGSFPAGKQKKKNIVTDGTLLKIGGAGYLALNLINTLRDGDPPFGQENLPHVLGAAGAMALGTGLRHMWPKRYRLGKKYSLKVLPTG